MSFAKAIFRRVSFRMKRHSKLLLLASALFFPLGRQTEIEEETSSLRNFVSWSGCRISPYFHQETETSRWAQGKLGLRSKQKWTQVTSGPIWFSWHAGTPPGNWMTLSTMHRCYQQAPDADKQQVCEHTLALLSSTDYEEQRNLSNSAVTKWLR
jgi:hypothetical protein